VSYATIDDLRSQLGSAKTSEESAAYAAKMLHPLPEIKVVKDRAAFILEHCAGKRVLEFGASGPLTPAIRKTAAAYLGVDRHDHGDDIIGVDLDDVSREDVLPVAYHSREFDVVVCGEVVEHLGNPQWFLTRLKRHYVGLPVLVTVPNAFSDVGRKWILKGTENVNADHVAWYSPKTLSVLLQRAGFTVADLYYYNGSGPTAEGLIVVTE
jgi:2-polyprenyl-3-methyl-5-hydroxy-6-metoxy-1,4-benzoquinol methylase